MSFAEVGFWKLFMFVVILFMLFKVEDKEG